MTTLTRWMAQSLLMSLLTLGSSAAVAAPFLGTGGTRSKLEQKFLSSSFCKQYGCVKGAQVGDFSTFRLNNKLEVWMEHCCLAVITLRVNLVPPRPLIAGEVATLRDLTTLATAEPRAASYDFARNCSSVATIRMAKKLETSQKPPANWTTWVGCFEEKSTPPRYFFQATLPG